MVTKPFKTERICELAEDVRKLRRPPESAVTFLSWRLKGHHYRLE